MADITTDQAKEVLGVSLDASPEMIRSAYKTLVKQLHPDANRDDPTAEEKFQHIKDAYELLSGKRGRASQIYVPHADVHASYEELARKVMKLVKDYNRLVQRKKNLGRELTQAVTHYNKHHRAFWGRLLLGNYFEGTRKLAKKNFDLLDKNVEKLQSLKTRIEELSNQVEKLLPNQIDYQTAHALIGECYDDIQDFSAVIDDNLAVISGRAENLTYKVI